MCGALPMVELKTMPTASIIITTHNRPSLLPAAIKSAQAAGKDIEVIVVDDASTDETEHICRQISNIRYVRVARNQKVAGARNIGILASCGEYITFLDDDDIRLPGTLDLQIEALDSRPTAGLVYAQALVADQSGNITGDFNPRRFPEGDVFWQLLSKNFIPCGTAVFRRACLFRVGLLDETVPGIDDWDLWIRTSALYDVMALQHPVIVWRRSTPCSGQGTSRADKIAAMATHHFRQKWLKLPRAAAAPASKRREVSRQFSDYMVGHLALETTRAFRYGSLRRARKNMFAAFRLHLGGSIRAAIRPSTFHLGFARAKQTLSAAGIEADFMQAPHKANR